MSDFEPILDRLKTQGLFRTLSTVEPVDGGHVRIGGREFVSFAGNDYLGLRMHPSVVAAANAAAETYGVGAGASRLLAGTTPVHVQLEAALAAFTGRERALVFPSGYQTNVGVLSALTDEDDVLILDSLCHASLIDGARLSKAQFRVYPHGDTAKLSKALERYAGRARRFIVTEGVFSMDGDLAPLGEICRLAQRHQAWVVLDDAHAFGVLGEHGRGTAEHLGVVLPERSVFVGTLSKALGSQGGFAAASASVIDLVVNSARSFIYTTGLSPASAGAALKALDFVTEPSRRKRLLELAARARAKLKSVIPGVPDGVTPIIPVIVGDVERTTKLASHLLDAGIFAPPIRPPTVPKGTARLRISLSADHTERDIDRLAVALGEALARGGFSLDPPRAES